MTECIVLLPNEKYRYSFNDPVKMTLLTGDVTEHLPGCAEYDNRPINTNFRNFQTFITARPQETILSSKRGCILFYSKI